MRRLGVLRRGCVNLTYIMQNKKTTTYIISLLTILLISVSCNTESLKKQNVILSNSIKKDSIVLDSISKLSAHTFNNALELERIDSAESVKIYTQIINNDSTSYWGLQASSRLRFLKASSVENEFIYKLSDSWDWTSKGTNWGEIERKKAGVLERRLIIKTNGEIEFYENGKLTQTDHYKIKLNNLIGAGKHLMELETSKQIYSLWYDKTTLTLTEPNCDCGCLTNRYFRKWKHGM